MLCVAALVLPAFEANAGVVLTNLFSFGSVLETNGVALDGAVPLAGLVQGNDGDFYGTTGGGGTNNCGTIFKISTNGTLTSLYSFVVTNDDGYSPYAGLVQGRDGNFYGTTVNGGNTNFNSYPGSFGYGTVFKVTKNGTLTSLYSFGGTNDGTFPFAGLVQGNDGDFYGTTMGGGKTVPNTNYSYGTVFKITTNGVLTGLYYFTGTNDGAYPQAGLVQGSDGNFYGTTYLGGTNNWGTVFKISTNGALTSLYSFGSITDASGELLDGIEVAAGLVEGKDGDFYGTTTGGGTNGYGTIFKINTNGRLTTLHSFGSIFGSIDGANPVAGLVQGSDGNFYGTTEEGGTYNSNNSGTVFEIDTNGAFTTLYSFDGDIGDGSNGGANPEAGLVQGNDGNFYGTTSGGGTNYLGTVFCLNLGLVSPPAPQLSINLSGNNLILTWPTNVSGLNLEYATNLASTTVWQTNSTAPVVIGGQNVLTNPITGTQMFFRLSE
jgi:uncharacterized repeat protein (TIGR03803 family)